MAAAAAAVPPLGARQIVDIADRGGASGMSVTERATLMLAEAAHGEGAWDAIDLATREAMVLELRCATLGDALTGRLWCPVCRMQLVIRLDGPSLHRAPPAADAPLARVEVDGWTVTGRSPDGRAMVTAAACAGFEAARASLLASCVVEAALDGCAMTAAELPEHVVTALGEALVARDPGLDVRIRVTCAACDHEWRCCFDAASYFWTEIESLAARVLDEVHTLAGGYGWTEDEVLRLSSRRRQHYVDRLVGG